MPPRFAGHTFTKAGKYNVMLILISGGTQYISVYISVAPITVS
jgi:hypothetical protein